jgi:hypothetical protein
MVYDQIWLNLLMDDHHFCYIYYLSMDDCHFGCIIKFLMYLNTRFPIWFPTLLHCREHTGMLMQGVTSLGNVSFWESFILGRSEGKGKASVSRDMWNFPANAIFWVCALKFKISGSVTFQGHDRDMLKVAPNPLPSLLLTWDFTLTL